MMNTTLLIIAIVSLILLFVEILINIGAYIYIPRKARETIREDIISVISDEKIGATIRKVLQDEKTTDKMVEALQTLFDNEKIINSLTTSIKMSVLGKMSGDKRLAKGLDTAMKMDLMGKTELGSFAMAMVGDNVKDYLDRNPRSSWLFIEKFVMPRLMEQYRNNAIQKQQETPNEMAILEEIMA